MSDTMSGKHLRGDGTDADASAEAIEADGGQIRLEQPGPAEDRSGAETPASATPVNEAAATPEQVVCPECGTVALASLNRRRSEDFCARCDYPLFWTPTEIVRGEGDGEDLALRRLPGTVGRVAVASAACPHCAEANQISAVTCVRCGGSMQIEQTAVVPIVVAPPEKEPTPLTPIRGWVWAAVGLALALLVWLILYLIAR